MKFRFNLRFFLLGIAMLLIQIGVSHFLSGKDYGLFLDYVSGISKIVFTFSFICALFISSHRISGLLVFTIIFLLFQCIPFRMTDRDIYISLGILTGGVIEMFTFIGPVRAWLNPQITDSES